MSFLCSLHLIENNLMKNEQTTIGTNMIIDLIMGSDSLSDMLKRFDREEKEAMKDDNYVLEMFEYEMGNHEYDITHSDMKILEVCGIDVDEFEKNARLKRLYNQAQKAFLSHCYD